MKLFPYQEEGVAFMLQHRRCLNACEMGLGKTLMTLEVMRRMAWQFDNALFVVPASLTCLWQRSLIEMGYTDKSVQVLNSQSKLTGSRLICSYNFIQKERGIKKLLDYGPFDLIVCDEAHACKNTQSRTYQGLKKIISKHLGRLILLTGTPATNKGTDYYSYLELCEPGKHGAYWAWCNAYCRKQKNPFRKMGYDFMEVREDKRKELKELFKKFTYRRTKKQVLTELPPVMFRNIPVEVEEQVIAECLKVSPKVVEAIIEQGGVMPGHLMTLRRGIGLSKINHAINILTTKELPVIVVTVHKDVADKICDGLVGRKVVRLTGDESAEEKAKNVEAFQNGFADTVVMNVKAGGVGVTLTRASWMLVVELDWSPAVMAQAYGRIDRIGQAMPMTIEHLIGAGTLDEQVVRILGKKNKYLSEVM